MTYVYCSNQTNQLIEGGPGTTTTTAVTAGTGTGTNTGTNTNAPNTPGTGEDKEDKEETPLPSCGADGTTLITDAKINTNKGIKDCNQSNFETSDCRGIMDTRSADNKKQYNQILSTSLRTLPSNKHGTSEYKQKHQCKLCMKGSKVGDYSTQNSILSSISDNYAEDYCDAISVGCKDDEPWMYAYTKQDWDEECKKDENKPGDRSIKNSSTCAASSWIPTIPQVEAGRVSCGVKVFAAETSGAIAGLFR